MTDQESTAQVAREALTTYFHMREHAARVVMGVNEMGAPRWDHPGVRHASHALTGWEARGAVDAADVIAAWWHWAEVARRTTPGIFTVVDAAGGVPPGEGAPEGGHPDHEHDQARRYVRALGALAEEVGAWEAVPQEEAQEVGAPQG